MMVLFGLILFIHGWILTKLIFFPYPEMFIYPYLTNNGLIPYKQIFDQHFPGLLFLPINFNNLGMVTPEIARIWLIGVTVITQLLLFLVARKLFKSNWTILANLIYLIWHPFLEGWTLWIDSFLAVFLLAAFYFQLRFLEEKRDWILLWVGFSLSLAILFKQVALPLTGLLFLGTFLQTKRIRPLFYLLLGLLPILLLTTGYFWSNGALTDLWFWTIQFNLTTYAASGTKNFSWLGLTKIAGVFSPLVLLPIIKLSKSIKVWLVVFLIGSLVGVLDRPDFIHFQPALPFVCLGISLVLYQLLKTKAGLVLVSCYLVLAVWWLNIFYRGHLSKQVLFFDDQTVKTAQVIQQLTKPKDRIFLFGPIPHIYMLLNTLPVGNIMTFQFPWFLRSTEDRFVQAIKIDQPKLIIRDTSWDVDGQRLDQYAAKLNNLINEEYEVYSQIGHNEIMRPRINK